MDERASRARIRAAHQRLRPTMAAADAYIDEHLAPPFTRFTGAWRASDPRGQLRAQI